MRLNICVNEWRHGPFAAIIKGKEKHPLTAMAQNEVCPRDEIANPSGMKEGFNDWGRRGYDDFVPGEVTKTVPSGYRTTCFPTSSASLPRVHRI